AGRKDDQDKDPWGLAPWDAFRAIVKVLRFGADKYTTHLELPTDGAIRWLQCQLNAADPLLAILIAPITVEGSCVASISPNLNLQTSERCRMMDAPSVIGPYRMSGRSISIMITKADGSEDFYVADATTDSECLKKIQDYCDAHYPTLRSRSPIRFAQSAD